jgi:hypothetical protein
VDLVDPEDKVAADLADLAVKAGAVREDLVVPVSTWAE